MTDAIRIVGEATRMTDADVDEVASAIRNVVEDSPIYHQLMLANGYHVLVEALVHPANADAIRVLRGMASILPDRDEDPSHNLLATDTRLVMDTLGLTPDDAIVKETLRDRKPDRLTNAIREKVREAAAAAAERELRDLPPDPLQN